MTGTIPKSGANILLFFYICNRYCIFLHFFCIFLQPRLIPPHPINPKTNPNPRQIQPQNHPQSLPACYRSGRHRGVQPLRRALAPLAPSARRV